MNKNRNLSSGNVLDRFRRKADTQCRNLIFVQICDRFENFEHFQWRQLNIEFKQPARHSFREDKLNILKTTGKERSNFMENTSKKHYQWKEAKSLNIINYQQGKASLYHVKNILLNKDEINSFLFQFQNMKWDKNIELHK